MLKNIGTVVMLVAAVFLAVVLVILPHNPTMHDKNTPDPIQTPLNPEISQNNHISIDTANSTFLNVNAYSSAIFHNPNMGNGPVGTYPPDIEKVISLFNSYVENQFKDSLIPGAAVVVVYKDKIVYLKTLGVKKVGESDPINLDTIFQIGSCSKAFTATAIASLVDAGRMTWNDTVQQYFPDDNEFVLQDPVATQEANMRDLLSHRSGMHDKAGNEHVLDFKYDFSEILYRMRYIAAQSEFRTKYAYNNIMFSLAGQSSARAASTTWPQLIKEKIYQPLNMNSSGVTYQEFVDNPNHSGTHVVYNGVTYYVDPLNLDSMGPAGSLSCSIGDMGNWLRFQLNNGVFNGQQVVSPQSLAETHNPQILVESNPNMEIWYALGWTVIYTPDRTFIAHAGSTRLSTTYTLLLPSEELGVVVMANEANVGQDFCVDIASKLISIYSQNQSSALSSVPEEMGETPMETLPIQSSATDPLPYAIDNYVGTYYSDYYGSIRIEKVNNTCLNLYPGNNPDHSPLDHESGNTFKDVYYGTSVVFSNFNTGIPREVYAERWDVNGGNGTFNRI